MLNKIKSFLNSKFYNRYKNFIARIFYLCMCFVIFLMCCHLIDHESIDYLLSLPIGHKCGIIFLIYVFIAPPTFNDIYQDEAINFYFHSLLNRIERLESCALSEEGADIGENERNTFLPVIKR